VEVDEGLLCHVGWDVDSGWIGMLHLHLQDGGEDDDDDDDDCVSVCLSVYMQVRDDRNNRIMDPLFAAWVCSPLASLLNMHDILSIFSDLGASVIDCGVFFVALAGY
jgi:hypothetical protein